MFIPIHDKNPLKIVAFQLVTLIIILSCIATFVWQLSLSELAETQVAYALGVVPSVLFNINTLPPEVHILPSELTLVSYMFLHGGWLHLLGNMLFLWVFGDNVEDSMGHLRFIIFFLLCGLLAGLAHSLMLADSQMPLIGASGAVAGVLGGYLMLHPRVKVLVLLFSRIPLRLPAYLLIIGWILFQFFSVWTNAEGDNIAWWAHIGGFVAGMILIIPLRYKRVPLFDRDISH